MRSLSILLALVAACDVGSVTVPAPGPNNTGPDATPDPTLPDAAPGTPDGAPATAQCKNGVNTAASGNHNPGTDCMAGNCHGPGGAGPLWTVAGTLYGAANGGAPITGATITVIDANNVSHDLVSALNGNFYTGETIPLPAKVYASKCPAISQMNATVSVGSCNSCHTAGSATGAVHLP